MKSLEFVTVGDPGNTADAADSNGLRFGQVDYSYMIAKYETTYGQYVEFLNAVAKCDPHKLFNLGMQYDRLLNGIARDGNEGSYVYELLDSESADKPVNYVNFLDAVRFCNWMHNGQGNGSTETGAYTIITGELVGATRKNNITTYKAKGLLDLNIGDQAQMSGLTGRGFDSRSTITSVRKKNGYTYFTIENDYPNARGVGKGVLTAIAPTHNSNAKFWIPTENEWYKAAYYSPVLNGGKGGYFAWATQSDVTPGNTIGDLPNQANIRTSTRFTNSEFFPRPDPLIGPNMLTAVGSFTNSASYYGTFDQDGNITELNESIYDPIALFGSYNGSDNGTRSKRGASFYNPAAGTTSRDDGLMPNDAGYAAGFRLASAGDFLPTSTHASESIHTPGSTHVSGEGEVSGSTFANGRAEPSSTKNEPLVYKGILSSANELWPTSTPATGAIELTLNAKRDQAVYKLQIIGLDFGKWYDGRPRTTDTGDDVAGMHFHHAPFYTVGDVCIGLLNPNQDSDLRINYDEHTCVWTLTGKWTASDRSVVSLRDSLEYIYAGELYTNIHTERVALGEIRAQFNPVATSSSSQMLDAIAPYAGNAFPRAEGHCGGLPVESTSPHAEGHCGGLPVENTSPHSEGHCGESPVMHDDVTCVHPNEHCCETHDARIQYSGSGRDWLTGLDGRDIFYYNSWDDSRYSKSRRDIINDFNASEDLVDLHSIDANSRRPGLQGFTWIGDASFVGSAPGQLRYHDGVLSADLNGDRRRDFAIDFAGSPVLTADNFIF